MIPTRIKNSFQLQLGKTDCGAACVHSIVQFHGKFFSYQKTLQSLGFSETGVTMLALKKNLETNSMQVQGLKVEPNQLSKVKLPAILLIQPTRGQGHYVILYRQTPQQMLIGDPASGIKWISKNAFFEAGELQAVLTAQPSKTFSKKTGQQKHLLGPILKRQKHLVLFVIILGMISAGFNLFQALWIKHIIDELLPLKSSYPLLMGLVIFITLMITISCINYLKNRLLLNQITTLNGTLVDKFFDHFLSLPISLVGSLKPAELLARLNDSRKIQKVLHLVEGQICVDLVYLVISMIALFYMVPGVAVSTLLVFSFYGLYLWIWRPILYKRHRDTMHAYALTESQYLETLGTQDLIRTHDAKPQQFKKTSSRNWDFQKQVFRLGMANFNSGFGSELISILMATVPLVICAVQYSSGKLALGSWIATFYLIAGITPILPRIFMALNHWSEAEVSLERLKEFIPDTQPSSNMKHPVEKISRINFKGINFSYPSRPLLIQDLNLDLELGQFTVLTGNSGCGKSSLLNLIMGIYKPDRGHIAINRNPLSKFDLKAWWELVQLIPQDIKLFNSTVAENISLDINKHHQVVDFMRASGFEPFFKNVDVDEILGPGSTQLSAGETQLVGWSRALFKQPKVLLIDEACSYLDQPKKSFVLQKVNEIKKHTLILMVSHDQSVMDQADRVIHL